MIREEDAKGEDHPGSEAEALESILLRLIWQEHKRLGQALATYQLTVPQFYALRSIARHEAGCPMSRLAELTHQSSPTMTDIVDRLVKAGLVSRRQDEGDRRKVLVELTPAGQEHLERVRQVKRDGLRRALERVGETDRRELLRLLQAYLAAMEEVA
jgi:DNA-binding MarR family transcriptional regulator